MGKASRDKGARFEREIVNVLRDLGYDAERIPLSGAAGGTFSGDVRLCVKHKELRFEAKKRGDGFKELYKWLRDHDGLFCAADRQTILVVMPLDRFFKLVDDVWSGK